ncbi:hypothetical protein A2U01_0098229, partial [Trifolium medium]|nr:hypothetical protein [Trifolium medium]
MAEQIPYAVAASLID